MNTTSYNSYNRSPYEGGPYGRRRLREGLPWLRLLLLASLLATASILAGIVFLPAHEGGQEEAPPLPVSGEVQLVYPASLVQELAQPANGQWLLPVGTVTVGDATFILDTGGSRILKLDQSGRVIATLDSTSDKRLILQQPMALTSDGHRLFVANSLAAQVLVVDPSGQVEKVLSIPKVTPGEKTPRPIGIAVTSDNRIIVSDADNHRVLILNNEGGLIKALGTGTRAGGKDGFNVPGNLALDNAGNIYVVDTLNGRVLELSPDGAFVRRQFGQFGNTSGMLLRPKGVAVDSEGRVFVSDGLLAAIEVFAPDGTYLGIIGPRDPSNPSSASLFQAPAGLWLTGDRLYVVDRLAGLITLRLSGATVPQQATTGEGQGH